MARNVTYSVSPRINPKDKNMPPKYYGHVQANGDVSLREMSERIQQTCTVHKSDVFAVLVVLEDVKSLEAQGVEILTCGTCLNHYGLAEKLQVGGVTNMYVIAEKMLQASLIVKP